jgi:6-phosphogluconolactonase
VQLACFVYKIVTLTVLFEESTKQCLKPIPSAFNPVMKFFLTTLLLMYITPLFAQKQPYLLVGTYTGGKSKGIYVFRFGANGRAVPVDSIATPNPSFLAVSPNGKTVYAVNELGTAEGGGKVSAFRFNKTNGRLTLLNQQSSEGEHPCFVTADKTGNWVIAGNYSSGTVAVLPVQTNGSVGEAVTTVQHTGSSVTDRQQGPHVHQTVLSADNRTLFVPDLGIDKLMIYSFDASKGTLRPKDTSLSLTAGSGPTTSRSHPTEKWVYLLQELSGTITVFKNSKGKLQSLQTVSALPKGFSQAFSGADIHVSPNGRFLYASLRDESNSLAIFSIHPSTGRLTLKGHQSTNGKTPRNFNFDPSGNYLLVGNQRSDEIVIFRMNKTTGKLTDTSNRISVGSPVCIKWIKP